MTTGFSALLVAHVTLTTAGYVGLIATNLVVLLLCRSRQTTMVIEAVSLWRTCTRIFGPLLGLGILLGFGLAAVAHVTVASQWLLITYALIVLALGVQAAIMVPWQLRAAKLVPDGQLVSTLPVLTVLSVFTVAYAYRGAHAA